MDSDTMPVQSFNPTASPNGPVAAGTSGVGTQGEGPGLPASGGLPKGVQQLSGTDNLKADAQVKQGGDSRPEASMSASKPPAGVQSFKGTV